MNSWTDKMARIDLFRGSSQRPARTGCKLLLAASLLASMTVFCAEKWRNSMGGEGWSAGVETANTARESPWRSAPVPEWTNNFGFEKDAFAFARVRYTRLSRFKNGVNWNGGYWYSDYPDSDLNLSYRLQQVTSLKVDPNARVIDITDKELFDYPWIYIVEPGLMRLEDDEIPILRKYLLNGGFLMADDFWGTPQWENFEREIRRVLPEKRFTDLQTDHPIFNQIFDLRRPKPNLQVPNVRIGRRAESTGVTWELHEGEECKDVHFQAILDEKGRIVVLGCHNTDYGDGWEREGEDEYFFHRFSEQIAYPMAINIIFYAMTH
jgi:hypothetical protein